MIRRPILLPALTLVLASAAFAQTVRSPAELKDPMLGLQPPKLGSETNAALLYFQAFERLSMDDGKLISEKFENRAGWYPDEQLTKILIDNQRYLEDLMFAANTSACDFGVRFDQGIDALLPHLGKMRQGVRALLADARRCLREGNNSAVAKRMAAVFHIADHTRSDHVLISSLVGSAIASAGINATEALLADGKLTPEIARAVHTALKDIHDDDIFGFRGSITGESTLVVDWAKQRFKGPGAGAEFARYFDSDDDRTRLIRLQVEKLGEDELRADLDRMGGFYDAVRKAWDEPNAQAQLAKLDEQIPEGRFGLCANLAAAAFRRANVSMTRVITDRDRTLKRLDAFLRGEDPDKAAPIASSAEKKPEAPKSEPQRPEAKKPGPGK